RPAQDPHRLAIDYAALDHDLVPGPDAELVTEGNWESRLPFGSNLYGRHLQGGSRIDLTCQPIGKEGTSGSNAAPPDDTGAPGLPPTSPPGSVPSPRTAAATAGGVTGPPSTLHARRSAARRRSASTRPRSAISSA